MIDDSRKVCRPFIRESLMVNNAQKALNRSVSSLYMDSASTTVVSETIALLRGS